jgi:hypothetical protein
MFRIYTDQDIREADLDLIYDFAYALVDLDKELMTDVLFLASERLDGACRCSEQYCQCEKR